MEGRKISVSVAYRHFLWLIGFIGRSLPSLGQVDRVNRSTFTFYFGSASFHVGSVHLPTGLRAPPGVHLLLVAAVFWPS